MPDRTPVRVVDMAGGQAPPVRFQMTNCPKFVQQILRKSREVFVLIGGRYWDRTSGPCRVKQGVGAYGSRICAPSPQLQQGLGIT
jgi:hypothetical protein